MIKNSTQKTQKAPWRERFLNVVERTIIELNIQFSNYSVGQAANGETKKRIFDRTTQGIEFADELTVCSAIVNDCLSSPMMSGDIELPGKYNKDPELKFYKIQREVQYDTKKRFRVDITTQRVSSEEIIEKAGGSPQKKIRTFETSYIEAKRAKRYPNSSLDSEPIIGTNITAKELKANLKYKFSKFNSPERRFYILVWGVCNEKKESGNTARNYLKEFNTNSEFRIKRGDTKIRWIPLSWDRNSRRDKPKKVLIEKWCWIILAEISEK